MRADENREVDIRAWRNRCCLVNKWLATLLRMENFCDQSESDFRFRHFDARRIALVFLTRNELAGHNQTGGLALARRVEKLLVLDVGNISRAGGFKLGHSRNMKGAIADYAASAGCCQISDCECLRFTHEIRSRNSRDL